MGIGGTKKHVIPANWNERKHWVKVFELVLKLKVISTWSSLKTTNSFIFNRKACFGRKL